MYLDLGLAVDEIESIDPSIKDRSDPSIEKSREERNPDLSIAGLMVQWDLSRVF